jgi:hypothetical protein
MNYKYWTKNQIEILEKEYSQPSPNLIFLSKIFNRLPSNISRKAKQIGIKTSYKRPKRLETVRRQRETKGWPLKKELELKELYNKYTNKELSKIFNKTDVAIEHKLKKLRLKKDIKKRGWKWRDGHPKGMLGKTHSEENKIKAGQRLRTMWKDPNNYLNSQEYRQILSDRAVHLNKTKLFRNRYSRAKIGKREDLDGLFVRSSWEANYARYLNWMKERGEIKDWQYEKETFNFPVKRGTRSYTPDFRVVEKDGKITYYEIKGWMTKKGATALKRMKKYYPEIKIVLVAKKEYYAISKWRTLISPNWEGPR